MSYAITPQPLTTAQQVATAFNQLTQIEKRGIQQIGQLLDSTFNAIWAPQAPLTPPLMAAACGNAFLPRLAMHAAEATLLLQQEAANGIDSSKHPWAKKQADGSFLPGIPAGWTVAPTLDANGNPTGAATLSYTAPTSWSTEYRVLSTKPCIPSQAH